MEVGKVRLIQVPFLQVDIASGMAIEGMCYAQVRGCCQSPCMLVSRAWATVGGSCAIHDQFSRFLPTQRVSLNATCSSQSAWADPRGTTLLLSGTVSSALWWWYILSPPRESQNTDVLERKNGFHCLCTSSHLEVRLQWDVKALLITACRLCVFDRRRGGVCDKSGADLFRPDSWVSQKVLTSRSTDIKSPPTQGVLELAGPGVKELHPGFKANFLL